MKDNFEVEIAKWEKEIFQWIIKKFGLKAFIIPFSPHLTFLFIAILLSLPFSAWSLIPVLFGSYFAWVWRLNRERIHRMYNL